jgi:carbonic anhydrase
MFVSRVEIVSFLAAASLVGSANAAGGVVFSYDPTSELGPSKWGDLDVADNACTGESNSPIAVDSSGCTRFEDYSFSVSTMKGIFKDINKCILLSLTPTLLISSFFIGDSSSSERRLYLQGHDFRAHTHWCQG